MPFGVRAVRRADTILLMLPTPSDNGARLAAVLPTGLAAMALGGGKQPAEVLRHILGHQHVPSPKEVVVPPALPAVRSLLLIVVDGLGHSNLKASAGHARTLSRLPMRRIETVLPSTTAAALTTITTGRFPGEHGLIGYKIRHPKLGLITTLKEWEEIEDPEAWQRSTPLFGLTETIGARAVVIGRPAHARGGLTRAILAGAEYHGAQTISERFSIASRLLREPEPTLVYLYVDELDREAHKLGWRSVSWSQRLEQLDASLDDLLRSLPGGVGVVVTADHGIVDIEEPHRLMLDTGMIALDDVAEIGGEPRLRSLYLQDGADAERVAHTVGEALGRSAWVGTREQAIAAGWFGGAVAPEVEPRLGEVLVAARSKVAFMLSTDTPQALAMVGQHGGISEEERGVPLMLGGSLSGTGFASALREIADRL